MCVIARSLIGACLLQTLNALRSVDGMTETLIAKHGQQLLTLIANPLALAPSGSVEQPPLVLPHNSAAAKRKAIEFGDDEPKKARSAEHLENAEKGKESDTESIEDVESAIASHLTDQSAMLLSSLPPPPPPPDATFTANLTRISASSLPPPPDVASLRAVQPRAPVEQFDEGTRHTHTHTPTFSPPLPSRTTSR